MIDPAPAVARQVQRLLVASNLLELDVPVRDVVMGKPRPLIHFITSGEQVRLERMLATLLGEKGPVEGIQWKNDTLG